MIIDDFRDGRAITIILPVVPVLAEPCVGTKSSASENDANARRSGEARESIVITDIARATDSRGDRQTSLQGQRAHCHIDLGLAILGSKEYALPLGVGRTNEEIAAYCGCRPQRIDQIYQKALRKLRRNPVIKGILAELDL